MLPFEKSKWNGRNGYLNKPWLSEGLLKSIKKTKILYKRYLCNLSSDRENQCKKYRDKLTCSLRAAKNIYYEKKLVESKSNMRLTWSILNEVINNKKSNSNLPRRLVLMTRKYRCFITVVQKYLSCRTQFVHERRL